MKFIKKFEDFKLTESTEVAPAKPKVKPNVKPSRPSPIRKDEPSVKPDPKAKKASAEEVVARYKELENKDI